MKASRKLLIRKGVHKIEINGSKLLRRPKLIELYE
jgi:hypothetical protein